MNNLEEVKKDAQKIMEANNLTFATIWKTGESLGFNFDRKNLGFEITENGIKRTVVYILKAELKPGQKIEINHGYDNDIRSIFEITKIDGEDIYLNLDCFWFPIHNDERRNIKLID